MTFELYGYNGANYGGADDLVGSTAGHEIITETHHLIIEKMTWHRYGAVNKCRVLCRVIEEF